MIRRPPRSTRTDTLFPYTTLFRSHSCQGAGCTLILLISRVGLSPAGRPVPDTHGNRGRTNQGGRSVTFVTFRRVGTRTAIRRAPIEPGREQANRRARSRVLRRVYREAIIVRLLPHLATRSPASCRTKQWRT